MRERRQHEPAPCDLEPHYTTQQVAEAPGFCRRHVRWLIEQGRLRYVQSKPGAEYRIPRSAVVELQQQRRTA